MNQIQKTIDKIDNYQQRHRFWGFSHAVIKKYSKDNAGYWAALLTYYGFLALFPLLMVLATLSTNLLGDYPGLEKAIIDGVNNYFPVLGTQLSSHIHGLQSSGLALIVGMLFTIYGTRGVAEVFRRGLRKIWGFDPAKSDGFPKGLLKSLAIIVVGGIGFITAAVIASYAASAGHGWFYVAGSVLVNLFILFWVFIFLINFSLPKHVGYKDIKLGAACAAIGIVILQSLGGYILTRELKGLDALYSYFALTLGLLFWIYLQAQTVYYANEIAVVNSKKLWPRSFKSSPKKS